LSEIDSVSVDGESAKLRVLLLAPGCNPNGITGPFIGYSHAEALARLHAVTLVILDENEKGVRPKAGRFQAIEVSFAWPLNGAPGGKREDGLKQAISM